MVNVGVDSTQDALAAPQGFLVELLRLFSAALLPADQTQVIQYGQRRGMLGTMELPYSIEDLLVKRRRVVPAAEPVVEVGQVIDGVEG